MGNGTRPGSAASRQCLTETGVCRFVVESIGILETRVRDGSNLVFRYSNKGLADAIVANVAMSRHAICVMTTQISIDTTVEQLESLRVAISKYTSLNATVWKVGRVALYQNALSDVNGIQLEVRFARHCHSSGADSTIVRSGWRASLSGANGTRSGWPSSR